MEILLLIAIIVNLSSRINVVARELRLRLRPLVDAVRPTREFSDRNLSFVKGKLI